MQKEFVNSYGKGIKDGIPIALGYLSVSFTFGIAAVSGGLTVWQATLISMTNLTSAGQFAGLELIVAGAPYIEMILTQLIINLRYALMSLSLSQKLHKSVTFLDRLIIAFGNTDEIFAVASGQKGEVGKRYMLGLITMPFCGWWGGTLLGALLGSVLPASVQSALGIAIYGMFLAIIIPPAKHIKAVRNIVILSAALSCVFKWVPFLNRVSSGFVIIICTVISAALGALMFPVDEKEDVRNAE